MAAEQKKYLAMCVDDLGMFVEKYEVSGTNAKIAMKKALAAHYVGGGLTQDDADECAKHDIWAFRRCASGSGPVWSNFDDSNRWILILR